MTAKIRYPILYLVLAATLVWAGAGGTALAAQSPQILLPGASIPKFVNQLPLLNLELTTVGGMKTVLGNQPLTLNMEVFDAHVLPPGTPVVDNPATKFDPAANGNATDPLGPVTKVFGYVVGDVNGGPGYSATGAHDTYIGPVIVNARNYPFDTAKSTAVKYVNNLGNVGDPTKDASKVIWYRYATDQTLHWADPLGINGGTAESNLCFQLASAGEIPAPGSPCAENYLGPIAAVPHLHGGEVPAELDGGPDAWWTGTPDDLHAGHAFYSADGVGLKNYAIYKYPNTQEAAPIWFHDHLLGGTRLNVYAGLAGAYLIHDPGLNLPAGLSPVGLNNGSLDLSALGLGTHVELTVPLVIQDRSFDTEGQFFYQSDSAGALLWATNPEHPYWTPEFLGDVIVVNGKAWPNLNVEPKRYRFWLINGSNARTYELYLIDPLKIAVPPRLYTIANDGGYLDAAALDKKLILMPGERYEVIIDFAGLAAGTKLVFKNTAKSPFPAGVSPQGSTTGLVMQFTVGACTSGLCGAADPSYNPVLTPTIRPPGKTIVRLPGSPGGPAVVTAPGATQNVQATRQLTLNEVLNLPSNVTNPVTGLPTAYPGGPLEILVNNTKYGGSNRPDFQAVSTKIPGTSGTDVTYYSEIPAEGTTELWEIVNLTADAHPIHLHLVQFQIVDRQNYNTNNYIKAYNAAFPGGVYIPGYGPPLSYNPSAASGGKWGGNPDITPHLQSKPYPPTLDESGWEDTVVAYPAQVTRIAVRWAPQDVPLAGPASAKAFAFDPQSSVDGVPTFPHGWVWHCHIVDHEDNEMMRPFTVTANSAAPATVDRAVLKGRDF